MALTQQASSGAVEDLGRFIESVRYEALPPIEQTRSKIRLLDAIGCAFAGSRSEPAQRARTLAERRGAAGPSSFWLSGSRGSCEDCVFVNSILVQSLLLDDQPHTGAFVIPAALAIGEAEGRSGSEILAAIAVGYETHLRIESGGLTKQLDAVGFRRGAMPGAFGAAAAAAYLARLPSGGIADALALTVATCAPGSYLPVGASPGTSERFVQLAANAKAGVLAVALAKAGFTGIRNAFEGEAGLYAVYQAAVPAGLVEGLGKVWHTDRTSVKPYPCGSGNTGAIYCAEKLMRDRALRYEEIVGVEVRMEPWSHTTGVIFQGPFTNLEQAIFSVPYAVAATLVYGTYDAEVLVGAIGDPRVDALAQRVKCVETTAPNPVADPTIVELSVALADGTDFAAAAADMPRAIRRPNWDEMTVRFHGLAKELPAERRSCIIREVSELDHRADCTTLLEILRSPR